MRREHTAEDGLETQHKEAAFEKEPTQNLENGTVSQTNTSSLNKGSSEQKQHVNWNLKSQTQAQERAGNHLLSNVY